MPLAFISPACRHSAAPRADSFSDHSGATMPIGLVGTPFDSSVGADVLAAGLSFKAL